MKYNKIILYIVCAIYDCTGVPSLYSLWIRRDEFVDMSTARKIYVIYILNKYICEKYLISIEYFYVSA